MTEIINCIGRIYVKGDDNVISVNKIDNKAMKKTIFLELEGINNDITSNEISNCKEGIIFKSQKNNTITDNVFNNIDKLFIMNNGLGGGYSNRAILIQRNNYIKINKIFNRQSHENCLVKYDNNFIRKIECKYNYGTNNNHQLKINRI